MIQLIVGAKGKGKTKHLLEKVNNAVKTVDGNIVYLDKNSKHMYELKNRIRLINTSEFPFSSTDEFFGFICGIVSQDHDLQELYLDSFMDVAFIKDKSLIEGVLDRFEQISSQFSVDFVISVSLEIEEVPEKYRSKVIVAL
ncbi:MAG: twitching motility protein PilT [Lachnospiraceae bacterium]|nr:twitching motility protein PilT [Lachnospiraceae bacterium]